MLEKILNMFKPYMMVIVGCSVRKGGAGWYSPGGTKIFFTRKGIEKAVQTELGYGCVVKGKMYYLIPVVPFYEDGVTIRVTISYDREFP